MIRWFSCVNAAYAVGYSLNRRIQRTKKQATESPSLLRSALSSALGVESLSTILSQYDYILTLDFAIKLLVLNERRKAGFGTILCGDTGVGKVYNFLYFDYLFI